MTLGELLNHIDFYFEKDNESGHYFIYDRADSHYEEECETLSEILGLVDGHFENFANDAIENISIVLNESVLSTKDWTYKDFADYIKGRMSNLTDKTYIKIAQDYLDVCLALADPKNIELCE